MTMRPQCTLNANQTAFGELQLANKKVVTTAYCTSRACAGESPRVEKQLTRLNDRCPDCFHYLVFKERKTIK